MAGSIISLEEGSTMTASFRSKFPDEKLASFYSSEVFLALLEQEGCVGIRIYNAVDQDNNLTDVLVGVDSEGNDLVNGIVYNKAGLCPPGCAINNPLNS
ncbi:MAG: hypothetical protein RLZZ65_131 [Bacteroidota bacterium]|jgi:hypothetical protein